MYLNRDFLCLHFIINILYLFNNLGIFNYFKITIFSIIINYFSFNFIRISSRDNFQLIDQHVESQAWQRKNSKNLYQNNKTSIKTTKPTSKQLRNHNNIIFKNRNIFLILNKLVYYSTMQVILDDHSKFYKLTHTINQIKSKLNKLITANNSKFDGLTIINTLSELNPRSLYITLKYININTPSVLSYTKYRHLFIN